MKISYRINQSILMMAVLTLFITVLWAMLGISKALNKSDKPVVSQKEINPIQTGFDRNTLNRLQERQ